MGNKIKFGTDGWRAIIAQDYTVDNVIRVAEATSKWLKKENIAASVVLGYDTRFGGKLFAETVAVVLAYNNIKVHLSESFCSTPMVSLGTVKLDASLGIVITASHNPATYNGFKLKGSYGGPLTEKKVKQIESLISNEIQLPFEKLSIQEFLGNKTIEYINLESIYIDHLKANFDIEALRESGIKWVYDAMYGAGQNVIKKLFPETKFIRCEVNPSFKDQAPEPIERNLKQLSDFISNTEDIAFGLATDGDADRLGLMDKDGNFIDSHHIILLLIQYLHKYRGEKGKVVTAFSTSSKIKTLCKHYGLQFEVSKIGFKYICDRMLTEEVLIGGEESGGMAVNGHIPERDGIWIGLLLWEMIVKTGKSLNEMINEIYAIVGKFDVERVDLHIKEELKNRIIFNCQNGVYNTFGKYKILRMEDLDGYKFFIDEDKWIMIRASGTEPVLRTYAEANDKTEALNILESSKTAFLEEEKVYN